MQPQSTPTPQAPPPRHCPIHIKIHPSSLLSSEEEKPRYGSRHLDLQFTSLFNLEGPTPLRFKMEILIFASRVIKSEMSCLRSAWHRAEGYCVLFSMIVCFYSVLQRSCYLWASGFKQPIIATACILSCKGLHHSPGFPSPALVEVWFPKL